MKQKILIIGDSLASHRDDDDYSLNERWPSLLENKSSFSLINLSKSFSTTKVLKTLKPKIIKIKPSHVVIQLGIVDCVPRTFHKIETQILYRLPQSVRLFLIRTIKKIRTQSFSRSYVKPNEFKNNIKHFCEDIDCKVIFVKILPASRTLISKNKNAQSIFRAGGLVWKIVKTLKLYDISFPPPRQSRKARKGCKLPTRGFARSLCS